MRSNGGSRHIYLLGGSIKQNPNGTFSTLGVEDSDHSGLCNDRWRVEAVALMFRHDPRWIAPIGGSTPPQQELGWPTIASVNVAELAALGVPAYTHESDCSQNTYQQLLWLQTWLLERYGQEKQLEEGELVTNDWHLPRVYAMIQFAPKLSGLRTFGSRLILVPAERELERFAPERWSEEILRVRSLPEYASRVAKEAEGIRQIMTGSYKFA